MLTFFARGRPPPNATPYLVQRESSGRIQKGFETSSGCVRQHWDHPGQAAGEAATTATKTAPWRFVCLYAFLHGCVAIRLRHTSKQYGNIAMGFENEDSN